MEFISKILLKIWVEKSMNWPKKMRKKIFTVFDDYRRIEFCDESLVFVRYHQSCAVRFNGIELNWIANEVNTEITNKQIYTCIDPTAALAYNKIKQAMSIKIVCRRHTIYAITFHIHRLHRLHRCFCIFQIDFIIVWIMVIIANYNLLFKPLGLTALSACVCMCICGLSSHRSREQSQYTLLLCVNVTTTTTTIVYLSAHAFAIQLDINSIIQYVCTLCSISIHGRHIFFLSLSLSFIFFGFSISYYSLKPKLKERKKNHFVFIICVLLPFSSEIKKNQSDRLRYWRCTHTYIHSHTFPALAFEWPA